MLLGLPLMLPLLLLLTCYATLRWEGALVNGHIVVVVVDFLLLFFVFVVVML